MITQLTAYTGIEKYLFITLFIYSFIYFIIFIGVLHKLNKRRIFNIFNHIMTDDTNPNDIEWRPYNKL